MKKKILSESEKKRLDRFEQISTELQQQGYTRQDRTVEIGKANIFTVVLLIPLLVIGYGLNYIVNRTFGLFEINALYFIVSVLVLIVLHELIHGIFWSLFTPNHFKDIEFGIMKPSMTPYCTCLVPLKKTPYIIGTVMPFILLGILPMAAGITLNNPTVLFIVNFHKSRND